MTLSIAITNLAGALLIAGEWDEAARVLQHAVDVDGFDDDSIPSGNVAIYFNVLPALRGEPIADSHSAPSLVPKRASETPQDRAAVGMVDAFEAAARGRQDEALRHAQTALDQASATGLGSEFIVWVWPLALRTAFELRDSIAIDQLLALLDGHADGHIPPLLVAERSLARARQHAAAADPEADAELVWAVSELRRAGSPYHLAHGLLDYADHLVRVGKQTEADVLREEVRGIAERLRAPALLARADAAVAVEAR
jgi:hypothetical protein